MTGWSENNQIAKPLPYHTITEIWALHIALRCIVGTDDILDTTIGSVLQGWALFHEPPVTNTDPKVNTVGRVRVDDGTVFIELPF